MLCERCHKNQATVRYAEVVDGSVRDVRLCPSCLRRHEAEKGIGFELSEPRTARRRRRDPLPQRSLERCRTCGRSLAELTATYQAGCVACYRTFGDHVESILEGMHRGVVHRGKVPRVDDDQARVRSDLQTKRALLRSAVRTENYEEAAQLRDEIRVLEQCPDTSEREG